MVWYKGKRTPKWEIAHISSKMSPVMVRMAWYDKNILVYEISILKLTIFYTQNCLWQETSIFYLRASISSWANAAMEMLDFISLFCWKLSKMSRSFAWKVWKNNHFLDFLSFWDSIFHENINLLTWYGYKYWFCVLRIPSQAF